MSISHRLRSVWEKGVSYPRQERQEELAVSAGRLGWLPFSGRTGCILLMGCKQRHLQCQDFLLMLQSFSIFRCSRLLFTVTSKYICSTPRVASRSVLWKLLVLGCWKRSLYSPFALYSSWTLYSTYTPSCRSSICDLQFSRNKDDRGGWTFH